MGEYELRLTLAVNIKQYRERRNWSQADLSEKAGLSIVYISDIERCNKWPYIDTLVKLAKAFEIEVYELLKPKENLPENTTVILSKYHDETLAIIDKSIELMRKNAFRSIKNLRNQYQKNNP
jgi:transcriptional regulator with XRE-family HTH domain